ncbi:unnamed protein product [Urochloa decumbens]|uniref:Uncharacterized protein n=1 Tax=Urochloa decumbens TaxID=240449 RepID=A0ABC9FC34_9POAL
MDRGGALGRGVAPEPVHVDLARHLRPRADLERAEHHGLAGHRRRRLERQHPEGGLREEVGRRDDPGDVDLHRGFDRLRRARPDLPRRHHRLPDAVAVVPHHRHHVAVPERRVVGVPHGHVHVHRDVERRRGAVDLRDLRPGHRRHHLRRPRPEHGEVERHEDDGEDDEHGHHHAAANQGCQPPGDQVVSPS